MTRTESPTHWNGATHDTALHHVSCLPRLPVLLLAGRVQPVNPYAEARHQWLTRYPTERWPLSNALLDYWEMPWSGKRFQFALWQLTRVNRLLGIWILNTERD